MALFAKYVWECIKRDKIKMRGSFRTTRRLRKKRFDHFDELYEVYRDELFIKKYGLTFKQWNIDNFNKYKKYALKLREKGISFEEIVDKMSNWNITKKQIVTWFEEKDGN